MFDRDTRDFVTHIHMQDARQGVMMKDEALLIL